jgi:hypothetical protein
MSVVVSGIERGRRIRDPHISEFLFMAIIARERPCFHSLVAINALIMEGIHYSFPPFAVNLLRKGIGNLILVTHRMARRTALFRKGLFVQLVIEYHLRTLKLSEHLRMSNADLSISSCGNRFRSGPGSARGIHKGKTDGYQNEIDDTYHQ